MKKTFKSNWAKLTYNRAVLGIVLALLAAPAGAFALDSSTKFCLTNETLMENITVYRDPGNSSWVALPDACPNGCDNVTFSCKGAAWEINVWTLVIIILIMAGIAAIWRYTR